MPGNSPTRRKTAFFSYTLYANVDASSSGNGLNLVAPELVRVTGNGSFVGTPGEAASPIAINTIKRRIVNGAVTDSP